MKHLKYTLALLVTLIGMSVAHATPPRYTNINDTPLAVNETHLFLIRLVADNEGSHYINNTYRFLIAQDLQTGAVDGQWLLDITRTETIDLPRTVQMQMPTTDRIDPFAIIAARKAAPIGLQLPVSWDDANGAMVIHNVYHLDENTLYQDITSVAAPADLHKKVAASLNPTLEYIPKDPGPTAPHMLDGNAYSKDLDDCVVHGIAAYVPKHDLVMLYCENGDYDVSNYQIYLSIKSE